MGGFLEGILKQALGGQAGGSAVNELISMVSKNPRVLSAIAGLLSTRDNSIGGSGGLGGLVSAFEQQGLGHLISGWVSTGPNPGISAEQMSSVLGADTLSQFAGKAGVPVGEVGSLLANLLPTAIDRLTPDGKLPDAGKLDETLGSLTKLLGH